MTYEYFGNSTGNELFIVQSQEVSHMTNIYSDTVIDTTREIIDMCKKYRQVYQDAADKEKGEMILSIINKKLLLTNAYVDVRFEATFVIFESMMKVINSIGSAIDKLPDKEEFNEVKTELTSKVNDTLKPLQEELENWKEILERGEKGGMYR
jgi:hypothetical protein